MAVLRIVPNIGTADIAAARRFYQGLFGLDLLMDHGWIATLGASAAATAQISLASEGGSGTPVPAVSIEVDDVTATFARAKSMGCAIAYPLTDEPWGVRRFFVQDPSGALINVLGHGVAG